MHTSGPLGKRTGAPCLLHTSEISSRPSNGDRKCKEGAVHRQAGDTDCPSDVDDAEEHQEDTENPAAAADQQMYQQPSAPGRYAIGFGSASPGPPEVPEERSCLVRNPV